MGFSATQSSAANTCSPITLCSMYNTCIHCQYILIFMYYIIYILFQAVSYFHLSPCYHVFRAHLPLSTEIIDVHILDAKLLGLDIRSYTQNYACLERFEASESVPGRPRRLSPARSSRCRGNRSPISVHLKGLSKCREESRYHAQDMPFLLLSPAS